MNKFFAQFKKTIYSTYLRHLVPAYHFFVNWLADVYYGHPSRQLIVIGITGTTGKTTSVLLIAEVLRAAGYTVGYTSTAMFSDGQRDWLNDKKMTMVGRFFTQKMLWQMVHNGCHYAIIETTSQGILQYRHRFINYDLAIFTGLYPEHIEAHGSFDNYRRAKGRLFSHLRRCGYKYVGSDKHVEKVDHGFKKVGLDKVPKTIVANLDDDYAHYFLSFGADKAWGYTKNYKEKKDLEWPDYLTILEYDQIKSDIHGTDFICEGQEIHLPLLGAFNASNAMTAIGVALSQDIDWPAIKAGLSAVKVLAGRLEIIDEGQPFSVIVDYAFEPVALSKIYETLELVPHKKIIHVLGSAGGGRDVARRPKLGQIAGRLADIVIVTNEDPYDDDPRVIIEQVAVGAEYAGKERNKNLFTILDRREAIAKALSLAKKGDIVLITGKGSEQAICLAAGRKMPWDDRQVVREELAKLQFSES
ncbi:MAG TPA: UDP-N-acetylmuramyl-tripeptide synthetase [bacterium]|jgi:UDP-N-acetylmuramoyl-L-alanyl-D-glutamate--2,6-diaminopimelate ligase|nr:UDP-N-acetylmuramyl-tripeptide synthetase [bacterium]HOS99012.1 UDP-N-acetylmuramyl-tripeptide synthetase [bacterium]HPX64708.1 UDP-N-acetylmuramyl-tripeptide synthetase [bacterium]HQB26627.1 UDP-N-acetylmuramyl-tripeptide synthetase [bacterium]HQE63360.1 UDP-N-acetylmuramyl-tripeptide synthetase [bacterium]